MGSTNLCLAIALTMVAVMVAVVDAQSGMGNVSDPVTNYNFQTTTDGVEIFYCRRTPGVAPLCFDPIECPSTCPTRSTQGPGNSACFPNCVTCTVTCQHRKPNCTGFGAVCYDPRFIGGDGVMFYFHGEKEKDFCIVSDNLHINSALHML